VGEGEEEIILRVAMTLSNLQRRTLEVYFGFRNRPVTVAGLIWANRRLYLINVVLFAAVTGVFYYFVGPTAAEFAFVACAAMLVRDVGYLRRSARAWSALSLVIDWEKVSKLLKDPNAGDSVEQKN
jgi:Flp pilus assembly protein TadB